MNHKRRHLRIVQEDWTVEDTIIRDLPEGVRDTRTREEREAAAAKRLAELTEHFTEVLGDDQQ
jgi:hypothetical protein